MGLNEMEWQLWRHRFAWLTDHLGLRSQRLGRTFARVHFRVRCGWMERAGQCGTRDTIVRDPGRSDPPTLSVKRAAGQ